MFHDRGAGTEAKFKMRDLAGIFNYCGRAMDLVWQTGKGLTVSMALLTLIGGVLPGLIAYVGKLIVDAVVLAAETGTPEDMQRALIYVGLEGLIVAVQAAGMRGLNVTISLLRVLLSQKVNVMILEKALTLNLSHFEDSEFYDRLTQARREASNRPLSLVNRTFSLLQHTISLVTYGALLLPFSPLAVAVLVVAGIPSFIVETRFSGEAFRLFRWRSPETRKRAYLEMAMAREDFAKEVQLYQLGPTFLGRYKRIFQLLYKEDRNLTLQRGWWGFVVGLLSSLAFYGAYAWIVLETVRGRLSLGEMTMYLMVFRQGQTAFTAVMTSIGGMYEDHLYLSRLYDFLGETIPAEQGQLREGPQQGDGIRFEDVWFTYPGAQEAALKGLNLHLRPGEKLALVGENGSGKTTAVKLLTRLYQPDEGRILLDGADLREWDREALRGRIGVIFQDFVRYQFTVGENIGVGDVRAMDDRERWREAGEKGMADAVVANLPEGYDTQLGRWFHKGQELSGGQWQKVALARAFMRREADILVLDEPTAAMDARAESEIFSRLQAMTANQMAVLISHRFSTVRMAEKIVVLDGGRVLEQGSHETLMAQGGLYARLFTIQAEGYR